VRITEQRRPDRDTIAGSSADRDYRMSTYERGISGFEPAGRTTGGET
jgi:hypothetical protein